VSRRSGDHALEDVIEFVGPYDTSIRRGSAANNRHLIDGTVVLVSARHRAVSNLCQTHRRGRGVRGAVGDGSSGRRSVLTGASRTRRHGHEHTYGTHNPKVAGSNPAPATK